MDAEMGDGSGGNVAENHPAAKEEQEQAQRVAEALAKNAKSPAAAPGDKKGKQQKRTLRMMLMNAVNQTKRTKNMTVKECTVGMEASLRGPCSHTSTAFNPGESGTSHNS